MLTLFLIGIKETYDYLGALEIIHLKTNHLGFSTNLTTKHLYEAILSFGINPFNIYCFVGNLFLLCLSIHTRRLSGANKSASET